MGLREEIITLMKAYESEQKEIFSNFSREAYGRYCTLWFKSEIDCTTAEASKELALMEKEGLVTADRRQSNNTMWLLTEDT